MRDMDQMNQIPDWVNYIAIDCDGVIWGFEDTFYFNGYYWIDQHGKITRLGWLRTAISRDVAKTLQFKRMDWKDVGGKP